MASGVSRTLAEGIAPVAILQKMQCGSCGRWLTIFARAAFNASYVNYARRVAQSRCRVLPADSERRLNWWAVPTLQGT